MDSGSEFCSGSRSNEKKDLESVMISFFNNKIQVLIASTIIESGTDRPMPTLFLLIRRTILALVNSINYGEGLDVVPKELTAIL